MGFKSMSEYNDAKYGNWFRLQNDGDYADVVFLYRSTADVMMADTHYIKSDMYSGYVTCCGKGCPACGKAIRVQPKLFIPLYVMYASSANGIQGRIQFWDRTMRFQPQLLNDVFRGYPNPSEYVFRITRHGVAGDINTTYDIRAISNNADPNTSYDAICSQFGARFPDYYNTICKEVDQFELSSMMTASTPAGGSYGGGSYGGGGYNGGGYGAVPRGGAPTGGTIPGTNIPLTGQNAPNLSMPSVPIQATIPEVAPDPNNLPFGDLPNEGVIGPAPSPAPAPDPLETDEDLDTTNLQF